ncbi:unnamed protein product [Zymoseptoria tritici ST99CH_1A5]|uniref:F-box domain-containing protein n=1 Tax=Zymoseptoria tritici ST99CH_1A5 TaxID=1276529 RepID=A0A1Y6LK86_ZYMTR|nr:unnamed protein product [Zymoseptoria tritici ST99CH_3D1]SMY24029.1 unnamed protein product [Zymoseptoria tritici ST99CH_1A5]
MVNKDRGKRSALQKLLAMLPPHPDVPKETQTFRLFDLPDELWLRIGKMVIDDAPAINLTLRSSTSATRVIQPPILQTCAALRNELRMEYFRKKITVTVGDTAGLRVYAKLGRYLRAIGPEARRQIRVRPPPMSKFRYWEWDMMFTPRRTPRRRVYEAHAWEITFL